MGDDAKPEVKQPADGGARAVRLTGVEGQVRVVQDGQVIADPAYNNLPLFEGSTVTTGNDGQAEVQLEDGSLARLSPNTEMVFSVLHKQGAANLTEIVLDRGLGYFELQPSTAAASLKVHYGETTFASSSFSVIRVNDDTPPGALAVFSGAIHLDRGSLQLDLHSGQSLSFDAANPTDAGKYAVTESIDPDSWDNWNADRDQFLSAEVAEKTAADGQFQSSAGTADLDAYGNWYDVPGQGYIWSPFEAISSGASWDPYGYGHWVYYPRYGYVWVSGYAWGYSPFQCVMWNYYDTFGWGWAPGGGCNPWYGGYGDGWYSNIGVFPPGYRIPKRPLPGPIRPRPIGGKAAPASVFAVDRRSSERPKTPAIGGRAEPVEIAGHMVEPMHPLAPRPSYDRAGNLAIGRAAGSTALNSGSGRAAIGTGAHPVYPGSSVSGFRPGQTHIATGYSAPGHPPSGSSGGSHFASAPSGGGGHPSGSGGGGGGGGGHASGGGGGGGSHK